ncbi:MAG: glycosyltransferase [Bacillota bacterium]
MKELTADYPNIFFIEGVIGREEVNALLLTTDCFISLHRSEGFGLALAEALYMGKPVIGTEECLLAPAAFSLPYDSVIEFIIVHLGRLLVLLLYLSISLSTDKVTGRLHNSPISTAYDAKHAQSPPIP